MKIRWKFPFQPTIEEEQEGARRLERDFARLWLFRHFNPVEYYILVAGLAAAFFLFLFLLDHFFPVDPDAYMRSNPFPF